MRVRRSGEEKARATALVVSLKRVASVIGPISSHYIFFKLYNRKVNMKVFIVLTAVTALASKYDNLSIISFMVIYIHKKGLQVSKLPTRIKYHYI